MPPKLPTPTTTRARYSYTSNTRTSAAQVPSAAISATQPITTRTIANPWTTTTTTIAPTTPSVSYAIDCSAAVAFGNSYAVTQYPNGIILATRCLNLKSGDSVFDLLSRCGISVESSTSFLGIYVSSIGGLREKACGGTSGWIYEVNGARPSTSCEKYVLKSGDTVIWRYVLSA
ncbi:MAG: DUF4430 domain-containing protein [Oscillospiraceae bacterium]|nr:DUF4430 domain-containing protein [Oscillospiraceae bacterium]